MSKFKTEIKWAFIFVAASLVWMVLEKAVGLHGRYIDQHPIYTNFFAIPAIAVYVFALRAKRKSSAGVMSWKQGFISGLLISVIVTIISPLTQVIVSLVISPEFFPNAIRNAVQTGKATQAAAEEYFNLKSYIVQGLVGGIVMGLITSAVVAVFTRTKKSQQPSSL